MAYSTQKDFLVINFLNFKYETRCTPLSKVIKLHKYCPITDYRSFSMIKGSKANYISDLVACRNYVISPCDEYALTERNTYTNSLTATESMDETLMEKFRIQNQKLKDNLECCQNELKTLRNENEKLKTIAICPKTKLRHLSIYNKIQRLFESEKITNDDQNELIIMANKLCEEINSLKDEESQTAKCAAEKQDKSSSTEELNKNKAQQDNKGMASCYGAKKRKEENNKEISERSQNEKKIPAFRKHDSCGKDNEEMKKLENLQYKIDCLKQRALEADRLQQEISIFQKQAAYIQQNAQDQIAKLATENQKLQNHLKYAEMDKKKIDLLGTKLENVSEENSYLKRQINQIDDLKDALMSQFQNLMRAEYCNKKLTELLNENDQVRKIQNLERELIICKHQTKKSECEIMQCQTQNKKLMKCLANYTAESKEAKE